MNLEMRRNTQWIVHQPWNINQLAVVDGQLGGVPFVMEKNCHNSCTNWPERTNHPLYTQIQCAKKFEIYTHNKKKTSLEIIIYTVDTVFNFFKFIFTFLFSSVGRACLTLKNGVEKSITKPVKKIKYNKYKKYGILSLSCPVL